MQHGEFLGFFSTVESVIDGDSGFSVKKTYWYVWDAGPRAVSVQKLDFDFKPVGPIMPLSRNEFKTSFSPEPDMEERPENLDQDLVMFIAENKEKDSRSAPSRRPAANSESDAPLQMKRADDNSRAMAANTKESIAEDEISDPDELDPVLKRGEMARRKRQCKVAEEKVRNLFVRDLDEFAQGALDEGKAFEAPLALKVDWLPEYKHMFSQLAIKLRKLKLYRQAIDYHSKALELAPEDYHIYFNMACVHYALGDMKNATYWLNQILDVAPDMDLARRFIDYIAEKSPSSSESATQYDTPDGPKTRAARKGPATAGVTRVSDPLPRAPRSGRSVKK